MKFCQICPFALAQNLELLFNYGKSTYQFISDTVLYVQGPNLTIAAKHCRPPQELERSAQQAGYSLLQTWAKDR